MRIRKQVKAGNTISKKKVDVKAGLAVQTNSEYLTAQECIKTAISELGVLANKGDELARESIANLGVVLLELKG